MLLLMTEPEPATFTVIPTFPVGLVTEKPSIVTLDAATVKDPVTVAPGAPRISTVRSTRTFSAYAPEATWMGSHVESFTADWIVGYARLGTVQIAAAAGLDRNIIEMSNVAAGTSRMSLITLALRASMCVAGEQSERDEVASPCAAGPGAAEPTPNSSLLRQRLVNK